MKIQLLYFPACPHHDAARATLARCLDEAGLSDADCEEVDVSAPSTPPELRGWGSPTILIDGRDVAGAPAPAGAASCRLYDGGRGAPTEAQILAALRAAREAR